MITWVGYDAPENAGAILSGYAEDGAEELNRFQDGLRATHQDSTPSHNTVIGHSYGSTVVGHTARGEDSLGADELIFVGSPGVSTGDAHELNLSPDNVHATAAEEDHINDWWVIPHNHEPTSDEFGATTFESEPGPASGGFLFGDAHKQDEYFDDTKDPEEESDPLGYIGRVVAGVNNPEFSGVHVESGQD